jgi:FAD/FMN-containing dehydrogenase
MKLYPKPKGREVAWVGLESPQAALGLFALASERAGAGLTAFELMIDQSLAFVLRHIPGTAAPLGSPHPWHVLLEISSGRSAQDARALIEEILAEGFGAGLAADATLAASLAQADSLWKLRESMSEAQRHEGASIKHDISVPVAAIPGFIDEAWRAVAAIESAARLVCFGHMGDGNLHYNISQPPGGEPAAFLARYREVNDAVHAVVRACHGSISAEHGIGRMKRDELIATAPPVAIELMRRIKAAFDPAGIMNPNKMI